MSDPTYRCSKCGAEYERCNCNSVTPLDCKSSIRCDECSFADQCYAEKEKKD